MSAISIQYERFFDICPDLLCLFSVDGDILLVNQAVENMLGYSIEEIKNRKFLEIIYPDDKDATMLLIYELSQKDGMHSFRNRLVSKNGNIKQVDWHFYSTKTEIYAIGKEILDSNKELFSKMAHKIRTPLNGLIGFIQLLENTELSEQQRELINNVINSYNVLHEIVDSALDISPTSNEAISFDKQSTSEQLTNDIIHTDLVLNNETKSDDLEDNEMNSNQQNEKQTILVVDDAPMNIKLLVSMLQKDYEVVTATSGEEALRIASSKSQPDLILLDVMMPQMSGYEVCEKLRMIPEAKDIPIIFLTALHETQNAEFGLKLGAIDYITKPFSVTVVKAKVKNHLALKKYKDMLKHNTCIDPLTQISNRRKFDEMLLVEYKKSKRIKSPLSILMMDIDYFKKFNDTYGHLMGDECLCKVARCIKYTLKRPGDLACRWGGEEFVCLLPDTNSYGAAEIGEKVRKAVEDLGIPHEASLASKVVTISMGVVTMDPETDIQPEELLKNVDDALYEAKHLGRNRIHIWNK